MFPPQFSASLCIKILLMLRYTIFVLEKYKVMEDQQLNWTSARDMCRKLGGDLASIANADEDNAIERLLPDENKWFWIGYNDIDEERTFKWSDGMPRVYENWGNGEGIIETEDCVMINRQTPHGKYAWCDGGCWSEIPFVCNFTKTIY